MTDNPGRGPADDGPHAMPHVRDAPDADDHSALDKDPTNAEAITDIANDESFLEPRLLRSRVPGD